MEFIELIMPGQTSSILLFSEEMVAHSNLEGKNRKHYYSKLLYVAKKNRLEPT